MLKVSIILPTYNEADNIIPLIEEILIHVPAESKILVVDDDSPDNR
jgi:dolichol-phosphate mannosyltransferase